MIGVISSLNTAKITVDDEKFVIEWKIKPYLHREKQEFKIFIDRYSYTLIYKDVVLYWLVIKTELINYIRPEVSIDDVELILEELLIWVESVQKWFPPMAKIVGYPC